MRRILEILVLVLVFSASGCNKINPRNNTPIDNKNGVIDEIKTNQNGVMAEIGKLKQSAEVQNSELKEIQNGLANINATVSRNENSGVQILQGDGSLILIFSLAVVGMILFWFHDKAKKSEKTATILADEIARFNDPVLNDNILKAAMYTDSEKNVYKMLNRRFQK